MSITNFKNLTAAEKIILFKDIQRSIQIPLASIEKDWWVVQTLRLIFQMDVAEHLLFKGGTSLSKAWNLIERFSEDVDLAIDREYFGFSGTISRTQVGKLRDASFNYLSNTFFSALKKRFLDAGFEEVKIKLAETKSHDQDPLIFEIHYPAITEQAQYVESVVKVEIGSRSMREPFSNRQVSSFVGEYFAGQPFADSPIDIPCVNPERTYLEKLFLLHEEFQRPAEKIRVNRLSRHLYDIQKISQTEFAQQAINDNELYNSIVKHREIFSKLSGVDYNSHFPPNLNPLPPDSLLPHWKRDYATMQEQMIYGKSSTFDELMAEIRQVVTKINQQTNIKNEK